MNYMNMIQNMNIPPVQMEIINHLINQNLNMQKQIEKNNILIQKIINSSQNNSNLQGLNINNSQNNNSGNEFDPFPGYIGKRTNICFETQAGLKKNIACSL